MLIQVHTKDSWQVAGTGIIMKNILPVILPLFLSGCFGQELAATCAVEPNTNVDDLIDDVYGTVTFAQEASHTYDVAVLQAAVGNVTISIDLVGFNTTDEDNLHGFHIHEFGDLSGGCDSTGGHFNPDGNTHGGPDSANRHAGDLGNIEENDDGTIVTSLTDDYISLDTDSDYSIIGLAVVIHQSEDDLGASGDPAGDAGRRIACCVIGASSPDQQK